MYEVKEFQSKWQTDVIVFLTNVLPESGRTLELEGRHKLFNNILEHFEKFWCLYDEEKLIGTVAVKKLGESACELKALYLYKAYQGQGLGRSLLTRAVRYAKENGYEKLYLDTISTSKRAFHLYKATGFVLTERYNENPFADIFMVLDL